jgi:hypothetical protein
VFHPVEPYWEALDQRIFAYTGDLVTNGVWYMDIQETMQRLETPWIPKFNSGMFLFVSAAASVFDMALAYLHNNRESEIAYFRGAMLPDEPFFAMALSKLNIEPLVDYGRFSRTLIDAKRISINVIKRIVRFTKRGVPVTPFIVHFCGRFGGVFYFFEKTRLFFCFHNPFQALISGILNLARKLKVMT